MLTTTTKMKTWDRYWMMTTTTRWLPQKTKPRNHYPRINPSHQSPIVCWFQVFLADLMLVLLVNLVLWPHQNLKEPPFQLLHLQRSLLKKKMKKGISGWLILEMLRNALLIIPTMIQEPCIFHNQLGPSLLLLKSNTGKSNPKCGTLLFFSKRGNSMSCMRMMLLLPIHSLI